MGKLDQKPSDIVPCRLCHAKVGEPCRFSDGTLLTTIGVGGLQPTVHVVRIEDHAKETSEEFEERLEVLSSGCSAEVPRS